MLNFRDGSPDMLFEIDSVENAHLLLKHLNESFAELNKGQAVHLMLFAVPEEKLKAYSATKNKAAIEKGGFSILPDK